MEHVVQQADAINKAFFLLPLASALSTLSAYMHLSDCVCMQSFQPLRSGRILIR